MSKLPKLSLPLTLTSQTEASSTSKHSRRMAKSVERLNAVGKLYKPFDDLPKLTLSSCKRTGDSSPSAASTRAPSEASTCDDGSLSSRSTVSNVFVTSNSSRSSRSLSARSRRYRFQRESDESLGLCNLLVSEPQPRPPSARRVASARRPHPKFLKAQASMSGASTARESTSESDKNPADALQIRAPSARRVARPYPKELLKWDAQQMRPPQEEHQFLEDKVEEVTNLQFDTEMPVREFKLYMQRRQEARLDVFSYFTGLNGEKESKSD